MFNLVVQSALLASPLDLDLIYDPEAFNYSLPRGILSSFLDGKAFGREESYSSNERANLEQDIHTLYTTILEKNPSQQPCIVITAGGPGAGKTILMKQDLEKQSALLGRDIAYIDPDDVCLKNMNCTYQEELKQELEALNQSGEERVSAERAVRQELYNKWRPGSNAANHLILAHLMRQSYGLYFGSTSSAPQTATFFKFLKDKGYSIRLLHVTASDAVRWESVKARDKQFVQTTAEDIRDKGKLFPQRLCDTYLKYADEIEFYYRDAVDQDAILAGKWKQGEIEVLDSDAYAQIQSIHNEVCKELGKQDLMWNEVFVK